MEYHLLTLTIALARTITFPGSYMEARIMPSGGWVDGCLRACCMDIFLCIYSRHTVIRLHKQRNRWRQRHSEVK